MQTPVDTDGVSVAEDTGAEGPGAESLSADEPAGPVFVDSSGRRGRKLRRLGWVLGSACACYAAVVIVSLLGGRADAPWLLIPGQDDDAPAGKVVAEPDEAGQADTAARGGAADGGPRAPHDDAASARGEPSPRPMSGARAADVHTADRPRGHPEPAPSLPWTPGVPWPGSEPTGPGPQPDESGPEPSISADPTSGTGSSGSPNPGGGQDPGPSPTSSGSPSSGTSPSASTSPTADSGTE